MSYPLRLQPLVIEDDEEANEAYKEIFNNLASEFKYLPFAPTQPLFAYSYGEAKDHLDSSKMFHLVVLDLRLPEHPKLPAKDGVDLGLKLLSEFRERHTFPVPSLLVISGHIGTTAQTSMQEILRGGFHYGRSIVKGNYSSLENEIRQAYKEAIRYCGVGIHVRDGGDGLFPTLNPRDEDLLRRAALEQHGVCGLDLNWWSAKRFVNKSLSSSGSDNWTKVLMGRFLLDGNQGVSLPKFFKLFPGPRAQYTIESARRAEHKLKHIKIPSTLTSSSTALIVTEKVGAQEQRPRSLQDFCRLADPGLMRDVARQITLQIKQLGDLSSETRTESQMLWPSHNRQRIEQQWKKFGGEQALETSTLHTDPLALYDQLSKSSVRLRLKEQSLIHGDLHASNVALDMSEGHSEAYIFDPGASSRDVAARDHATLEVSALLHQDIEFGTFEGLCTILYGHGSSNDLSAKFTTGKVGPNILELIKHIREAALELNDLEIYALMIFDHALVQLGGLAYGLSGNMIRNPQAAVHYLRVVADWYGRIRCAEITAPRQNVISEDQIGSLQPA